MNRLDAALAAARAARRTALITFCTAGFPRREDWPGVMGAMERGGADVIEVGLPFSDPMADGRTIQHADEVALGQGVSVGDALGWIRAYRDAGGACGVVVMTYYNPLLQYGQERFVGDAVAAGADGLVLVDVPPEEGGELRAAARAAGLRLVPLVAPTTSDARLARLLDGAGGFVYCVSVTGVTGARRELPSDLPEFLARVRRHTELPLAVGFGIAAREQVEQLAPWCDAVVVGSAIVDAARAGGDAAERIEGYVEVLSGRRRPA